MSELLDDVSRILAFGGSRRQLMARVLKTLLLAAGTGLVQAQPCPSGDSGEAERLFRKEAERHSEMIPNTIGA